MHHSESLTFHRQDSCSSWVRRGRWRFTGQHLMQPRGHLTPGMPRVAALPSLRFPGQGVPIRSLCPVSRAPSAQPPRSLHPHAGSSGATCSPCLARELLTLLPLTPPPRTRCCSLAPEPSLSPCCWLCRLHLSRRGAMAPLQHIPADRHLILCTEVLAPCMTTCS